MQHTPSLPKKFALLLVASLMVFAFVCPGVSGQEPGAKPLQISEVEFMGLRRLTQQQALAISGLQPGDLFSEALVDEAAKKLMDSGLFVRLGFRVKGAGHLLHVTFQVEEADRGLPISSKTRFARSFPPRNWTIFSTTSGCPTALLITCTTPLA